MEDIFQFGAGQSQQQRYKGYDRIMGNISWLLIALVTPVSYTHLTLPTKRIV